MAAPTASGLGGVAASDKNTSHRSVTFTQCDAAPSTPTPPTPMLKDLSAEKRTRLSTRQRLSVSTKDMLKRGMTVSQIQKAKEAHYRRESLLHDFTMQLAGLSGGAGDSNNADSTGDLSNLRTCFGAIDFSDLRTQALFDSAGGDSDDDDDEDEDNGDEAGSENGDEEAEDEESAEAAAPSKLCSFVVTPKWTSSDNLLWVLEQHWELPRPGCVYSIAGGSKSDVHPILGRILTRGLNMAVDQTDGWVISSGIDVGANKLLATGMRATGENAPFLGISAWPTLGAKTRRHISEACRTSRVATFTASNVDNADNQRLEPHHSHHIIVDGSPENDGPASATGTRPNAYAQHLRVEIEKAIQNEWQAPRLLLLLGSNRYGILPTLRFVAESLRAGVSVVAVAETKGAAMLVSRFMDTLTPPHVLSLGDFTSGTGELMNKTAGTKQIVPARARLRPALIPWRVQHPNYAPSYFVSHDVLEREGNGADPEDIALIPEYDPLIGRLSYEGTLQFDAEGYPRNPRGRTGMRGRGRLFRWGPNFASDPVVVREVQKGRYQLLIKWRKAISTSTAPAPAVRQSSCVGVGGVPATSEQSDLTGPQLSPTVKPASFRDWQALPGHMAEQDDFVGSPLRQFLKEELDDDEVALQTLLADAGRRSVTLGSFKRANSTSRLSRSMSEPSDAPSFSDSCGAGRSGGEGSSPGDSFVQARAGRSGSECSSPGDSFTQARKEADEEQRVATGVFEWSGIYRGYVDDERNTDNAWIETTVMLIRVSESLSKRMRSANDQPSDRHRTGQFEWIDLCRRGDQQAENPDDRAVLRQILPSHRAWVWCVYNFLASGSLRHMLISPAAASFFRHGELEDAEYMPLPPRVSSVISAAMIKKDERKSPIWGKLKRDVTTGKVFEQSGVKDEYKVLRRALHVIGIYRHLVRSVSFPAVEYSREVETVETCANEFKSEMLNAVLASYRRHLYDTGDLCGILESSQPGILQLLVRWGLPAQANSILRDLEYASERAAPKLSQALQAVLERGDDRFLETLLKHADEAGLAQDACKPVQLVKSVDLPRLYMPDKVRRRDLRAQGDAFGLLADIAKRVKQALRESGRRGPKFEQEVWWMRIDHFMRKLVDGYVFDKGRTTPSIDTASTSGSTRALGRNTDVALQNARVHVTFEDLFFWALVSGQPRMLELVWARVQDPLRYAAVGVEACRRIRRRCFSRGRGKVSSKMLLETIHKQLEAGLVGVLDNISKPKVGRTILIEQMSSLGCKRGKENLLTLGVRFRLRGLVSHDLSQGVLDNQWRGNDPSCGRMMLKLDNVLPYELHVRLFLLTLFGWTSLGHFLVPIVPNDARDRRRKSSSMSHWRGRRLPLVERIADALSIYQIPCVKHQLALISCVLRLIYIVRLSLLPPSEPLTLTDFAVAAFVVSATLQELRQVRSSGVYSYLNHMMNRLDLLFILVASVALGMRFSYALLRDNMIDCSPLPAFATNITSLPAITAESGIEDDCLHSPVFYRIWMVLLNVVQVCTITKLLCAFEPVGVLLASMFFMMKQLQRVLVPSFMIAVAFSVAFEIFDSPDGWRSPWFRFINIDDESGDTEPLLFLSSWLYTIAIDLLILNLMIAIMTDTYFKVSQGLAISSYRMSRVGLLSEFLSRPALPPPLDLLLLLSMPLGFAGNLCAKFARQRGVTATDIARKKYQSSSNREHATGDSGRTSPPVLGAEHGRDVDAHARADDFSQHHLLRALREYVVEIRRKEFKEAADSEASARIAEQQQQIMRLVHESTDASRLLLTQRDHSLELQNNQVKLQNALNRMEKKLKELVPAVASAPGRVGQTPSFSTETRTYATENRGKDDGGGDACSVNDATDPQGHLGGARAGVLEETQHHIHTACLVSSSPRCDMSAVSAVPRKADLVLNEKGLIAAADAEDQAGETKTLRTVDGVQLEMIPAQRQHTPPLTSVLTQDTLPAHVDIVGRPSPQATTDLDDVVGSTDENQTRSASVLQRVVASNPTRRSGGMSRSASRRARRIRVQSVDGGRGTAGSTDVSSHNDDQV